MKKNKKLLGMVLAPVMVLAMAVPTMAASITIVDAVGGETYNAYKIFDYTSSENAFSYTIDGNSAWKSVVEGYTYDHDKNEATDAITPFTFTKSAGIPDTYVVTVDSLFVGESDAEGEAAAADFAAYLAKNVDEKVPDVTATGVAGGNTTITIPEGQLGYYFVDTTTGALCSLFNNNTTQELKEKNELPTVDKVIVVGENEAKKDVDTTTASIDESVEFKITVTDGKGTDTDIVVKDTMDDTLTLVETEAQVKVQTGTTTLVDVASENYGVEISGNDITVTLKADYVKTLDKGEQVIITYHGKLNEDAVSEVANKNTVAIDYSKQTIAGDTVSVYCYEFDLVKTDATDEETGSANVLTGAKFQLYDAPTDGNKIAVVREENGGYRIAKAEETGVEIEAGKVVIRGLGNGTYYLEETQAPEGYNPLTARQEVVINSKNNKATVNDNVYTTGGVQVINLTGTILPSTGGIGTTVFYLAGIVVMAGAVFFVIRSKKRA